MIVATLWHMIRLPRSGTYGGRGLVEKHRFGSLAEIAHHAYTMGERIVWLAFDPDLEGRLDDPATWEGAAPGGRTNHIDWGTFRDVGVTIQRSDDPRWRIAPEDTYPIELSTLLMRLRDILGDYPAYSPASTGLCALGRWLQTRHALFPSPWPRVTPPLSAQGLNFLLPERYTGQAHIYLMDRTGAYLNVARNGSFGLHGAFESQVDSYQPSVYGTWQISDWHVPPECAHLIALPRRGPIWAMTNTLVWLEELGARFSVSHARIWPSRHRLMRDWAESMIACRAIHPCGKAMANGTIGMFGHRTDSPDHPWWYRPDWRAHIVSTNAMTTARTARKLEQDGHAVLAGYEDMLAIASDDPEPPRMLTDRETVLGGWHLQATYNGGNQSHAVQTLRRKKTVLEWLGALHAH